MFSTQDEQEFFDYSSSYIQMQQSLKAFHNAMLKGQVNLALAHLMVIQESCFDINRSLLRKHQPKGR